MASNTILEQIKEEQNESKIVGLMKELLAARTPNARDELLGKLDRIGQEAPTACKVYREIDEFRFPPAPMTLDDFICKVRQGSAGEPVQGIHWKVENGVIYANDEENSHCRDEEAEVRAERDRLIARKYREEEEGGKGMTKE